MKKFAVAVAGSTKNTVKLVQALSADDRFQISWCLTPAAKILGRKKVLTQNPLHQWADKHQVPTILIDQPKLIAVKDRITSQTTPDFLLVADFGYFIPQWLLHLPKLASINIHPSALPAWRGSSPGQFVILSGLKTSAVSFIKMNQFLDQGPILAQLPFAVDPTWTSTDYYRFAFSLAAEKLAKNLINLVETINKPKKLSSPSLSTMSSIMPQPKHSPTPLARRLTKADGFIAWSDLKQLMKNTTHQSDQTPTFLTELEAYFDRDTALASYVIRASKAFQPWPSLWTKVPTKKGIKMMKIFGATIKDHKLKLEKVQFEGQQPAQFNQVKNLIINSINIDQTE